MPRLFMIASTGGIRSSGERPSVVIRPFTLDDAGEVSAVLVAAYRGTSEEEPDDDHEVGRFLNNDWGQAVLDASFVAVDATSERIVGATLICLREDFPLVAHAVVLAERQGQGIAGCLISASSEVLSRRGEPRISLAVSAKNVNALRTYARLGFGLFAPEATVSPEGVRYQTRTCFTVVSKQIEAAEPDLKVPSVYGVGVKRSGSSTAEWPFINTSPDHLLPGQILALVTGWRNGDATISVTASVFDAAIALLTPAGAATFFDRPILAAWRELRSTLQPGDAPLVRFSTTLWEN